MCPFCGGTRLREIWHKTEVFYIYELEKDSPVKKAEIVDLCPGNGITVQCCECGELLHDGGIMSFVNQRKRERL